MYTWLQHSSLYNRQWDDSVFLYFQFYSYLLLFTGILYLLIEEIRVDDNHHQAIQARPLQIM